MQYSLNDNKGISLEKKLDTLFKQKRGGIFIELGANDGLNQSNTAFLEKEREWTGVLVEPSIDAYLACVKNRPNSKCYNKACVPFNYKDTFIYGDFDGSLMASVKGKRLNRNSDIQVECCPLQFIIDNAELDTIDLLSLDVEGYELEVLHGIDFNKNKPTYMVIEIYNHNVEEIRALMSAYGYTMEGFSNYNHVDHPGWDGTHNDYLFTMCSKEHNSN